MNILVYVERSWRNLSEYIGLYCKELKKLESKKKNLTQAEDGMGLSLQDE